MRALVNSIVFVAAVILSGVTLKFLPTPWIWVFSIGFFLCVFLCARIRWELGKNMFLLAAFLFLPLILVESYLEIQLDDDTSVVFTPSGSAADSHRILGYGPRPDTRIHAQKYAGDELIYDVIYSIGANGLRMSGPVPSDGRCLLFFGGSVTFGEGLPDEQALPYQVSKRLGDNYGAMNFAYSGYGPHQALAALEQGLVDKFVGCQPSHIFYMGIIWHVGRSAGLASWDEHGPKYRLNTAGKLEYAGHFGEGPWGWFKNKARKQVYKSRLYSRFFPSREGGPYRQSEIELFAAIVAQIQRTSLAQFPSAQFHVYLWEPDALDAEHRELYAKMMTAMRQRGLEPIPVATSWFKGDEAQYHLHAKDRHPSGLTNAILSEKIVNRWLADDR